MPQTFAVGGCNIIPEFLIRQGKKHRASAPAHQAFRLFHTVQTSGLAAAAGQDPIYEDQGNFMIVFQELR